MKKTILIIIMLVALLVCVAALVASRKQQKTLEQENEQLKAQIQGDALYTGIGKVGTGLFSTLMSVFI